MKEPEIRFKGFDREWKIITLKDICTNAVSDLIQGELEQCSKGYPVYGANGYIQDISFYHQSKPYIGIVKDGSGVGRSSIYPAYSSILSTMQYILSKDDNDIFFINNLLETLDLTQYINGSSIPHIYFKDYCNENITIPDIKEQRLIASYFQSLDTLIQATSKQLASLKQIKAASLQSMFPQEGETKPRVRFKGFEGEWKEERLFDLFIERHDISTITDSLPQLSFTISEGVIYPEDRKSNKRDFLIRDIVNKKYLITYVGDIIYNPANVVYGAIHRNSLCNGVVSPIYKIFKTEQDSIFMECIVRNPLFISRLSMKTEGTVTKLKTLKPESFLEMNVMITPSIQEQQKIGSYFLNLDRQITLQTRRLEKLKQIKAACLDKMFV